MEREREREMGMGWYGPLIELCGASSHVGEYVQLMVFLHRSTPIVEYKKARQGKGKGTRTREVVRTDIQVGDETRPLFSVSIWNRNSSISLSLSPGDILFLRNVKLIRYRSMVEATTLHFSSILRLIHPFSSLLSQGVDDLLASCPVQLIGNAKHKLSRLILWVQSLFVSPSSQTPASRNWKKVHEEQKPHECFFLSEVLNMSCPGNAIFSASISEVFLHSLRSDFKNERLFISRRLASKTDIIVEDMICLGCQLCGLPLSSNSTGVVKDGPLHCEKSSNRPHSLGLIYRPFLLYVWDNSEYIPLLVTNKVAELLFGNIIAENVYKSYKCQKDEQLRTQMKAHIQDCEKVECQKDEQLKTSIKAHIQDCEKVECQKDEQLIKARIQDCRKVEAGDVGSTSSVRYLGLESKEKINAKSPNVYYMIWLIVLKMLLVQRKNSPLKFEVLVSPGLEIENGRFKMMSVSISNAVS